LSKGESAFAGCSLLQSVWLGAGCQFRAWATLRLMSVGHFGRLINEVIALGPFGGRRAILSVRQNPIIGFHIWANIRLGGIHDDNRFAFLHRLKPSRNEASDFARTFWNWHPNSK
jgi:hypothetical protein